MDLFKKMMEKKKGSKMDDLEKDSKMKAVCAMKEMAEQAMSEKLGGLKKVTVASDSEEGLKEGLEKAEDVVEDKLALSEEPDMEDDDDLEEEDEDLALSADDLDAKIQKLLALKEKMKA